MKRQIFGHREEGIHYIKRPGVYGICFDERNNELQVAVINTPRGYFLPGGGIEDGEDHNACLKREFVEETGYDIELADFIGKADQVGFTPRTKRYLELQGSFYIVRINEFVGGKVEEDHELNWLNVTVAVDKMHLEYQGYAIREALLIYKGAK